jgi:hypothetical protein
MSHPPHPSWFNHSNNIWWRTDLPYIKNNFTENDSQIRQCVLL